MSDRRDIDLRRLDLVPPTEIEVRDPGRLAQRREVGRPRLPARAKRFAALAFLGLGVLSVVGLAGTVRVALADGLDGRDLVLLAMLTLLASAIAAQALRLIVALPGVSRVYRRVGIARRRRLAASSSPRPLLAQTGSHEVARSLPAARPTRRRSRLAQGARSLGWIALTLFVIGSAMTATILLGSGAWHGVAANGLSVASVTMLGMTVLIGFGTRSMSVVLVGSWFEKRLRRPGRLLRRLLRFLLRTGDRALGAMVRIGHRFDSLVGIPIRFAAAASGVAVIMTASSALAPTAGRATIPAAIAAETPGREVLAEERSLPAGSDVPQPGPEPGESPSGKVIPAAATGASRDTETNAETTLTTSSTTTPGNGSAPPASGGSTTTVPGTTTSSTTSTTSTTSATTTTTTSHGATTTTTTAVPTTTTTKPPSTTTTTKPPSTTTTTKPPSTTTTTKPADTAGPVVSKPVADPDMIFTSGTSPDSSVITANVTDVSGVASVTVYYRVGSGKFMWWGNMMAGKGDSYSVMFGPFGVAGTYEYRFVAVDALGNASCSTGILTSCAGGTVAVIIP
jgi:hypothetical protein